MDYKTDRLMTQKELDESRAKWDKIGPDGSKERDCAFMILRLAMEIEQALVPNQLVNYITSRYEQARFSMIAIRETFGITNQVIRNGMKRLMEIGLLHNHFEIPNDLTEFERDAVQLVRTRELLANGQR